MFRLTRQVRFTVDRGSREQLRAAAPTNSFGGFPTMTAPGSYMELELTLAGELDPRTHYLRNIHEIDELARIVLIPQIIDAMQIEGRRDLLLALPRDLLALAEERWSAPAIELLRLRYTPLLSAACYRREMPMIRLSQSFEFAAAHRLHNPSLDEATNRTLYGKCNNPNWHGHNYRLEVTLRGTPGEAGTLIPIPDFERIVAGSVIDRLDHRNLNTEVAEFRDVIPTVENIASVIYRLLKPALASAGADLASVTVWETPKTWCEYSEQ